MCGQVQVMPQTSEQGRGENVLEYWAGQVEEALRWVSLVT